MIPLYPEPTTRIHVEAARWCEDCSIVFPEARRCPGCGTEQHVALRMLLNRERYGPQVSARS